MECVSGGVSSEGDELDCVDGECRGLVGIGVLPPHAPNHRLSSLPGEFCLLHEREYSG